MCAALDRFARVWVNVDGFGLKYRFKKHASGKTANEQATREVTNIEKPFGSNFLLRIKKGP